MKILPYRNKFTLNIDDLPFFRSSLLGFVCYTHAMDCTVESLLMNYVNDWCRLFYIRDGQKTQPQIDAGLYKWNKYVAY